MGKGRNEIGCCSCHSVCGGTYGPHVRHKNIFFARREIPQVGEGDRIQNHETFNHDGNVKRKLRTLNNNKSSMIQKSFCFAVRT